MLKGLETLPVRLMAQQANAIRIADFLAGHSAIERVLYPTRKDHPQHELAMRQMSGGGSVIAFDVKGGKDGAFRFGNGLSIVKISNNLGDAKSLLTHPATTTHQRIGPEARAESGIGEGMLRLSCGLEDVDDLIEDIGAALACVG
jgi:O-succinylhomoserine sulfhydrylase